MPPPVIRIVVNEWDGTKSVSHEEDVTIQCPCGGMQFEQTYTGYAYYTAMIVIDKDDPEDVAFSESDPDVGENWETDWEFRCLDCYEYVDTKMNEALKTYKRYQEARPEDALKAYIDQVLFKTLSDEKKELLDVLKGGLKKVLANKEIDAAMEAAIDRASDCPKFMPPAEGVYECDDCGETEPIHALARSRAAINMED